MKKIKRTLGLALFLGLSAPLFLTACAEDHAAENAGEAIDEAVDDAGDAIEEAGDDIDDAVDEPR